MQPRGWGVARDVGGRSVTLYLIDPVERDVQPVAALVLDDGRLDRTLPEEDLFDTPIDADAVLEVHDVVARGERGEALDCRAGCVASRSADAALAAEDLVVGENAKTLIVTPRRNDEATMENSNREGGVRWTPSLREELVQTLRLPGIVTENDCRETVSYHLAQALHVAQNGLGRSERKLHGANRDRFLQIRSRIAVLAGAP